MNIKKQKFKLFNHLFWIIPLCAAVFALLWRVVLDTNTTNELIDKLTSFNIIIVIPVLYVLYIFIWLLGCLYHKKPTRTLD